MKNLLEFLLNRLVDHPEEVSVEEQVEGDQTVYYLHVNEEDIGKIIGKHGSVINAIRAIARIRALKENTRVRIEIAE